MAVDPEDLTASAGPHGMVSHDLSDEIRCPMGHNKPARAVVQVAWRRTRNDEVGSTWIVSDPMCRHHADWYVGQIGNRQDVLGITELPLT